MSMRRGFLWFLGPAAIFSFLIVGLWLWSRVDASTEVPVLGVAMAATVSGLILLRKPGNPVALLLMAAGFLGSLQVISEGYWVLHPGTSDPSFAVSMAAKATAISGTLGFSMMMVFLPIIFPTGRPHASWSTWVLRGTLLLVSLQAVGIALSGQDVCVLEGSGRCLESWVDPPGLGWVPNPTEPPLSNIFGPLIFVGIIGGLWAALARYWRAAGVERLQMKWFALAAFLSVLVVPVGILADATLGIPLPSWLFNIPFSLLPIGIGVAILRYRLYDIDRIISRTLSYALVVGLLGLIFAAGVVLAPSAVPGFEDSALVVAASTLVVAALFNPLRLRIQESVDLRFNRSRFDAERVMDGFVSSLRDQVDPDSVLGGWVDVVSETMQPAEVSVWVRA